MRVIAVSDLDGAVHNPKGLNIVRLMKHADKTGSVSGFEGGAAVSGKAMLEMPCDVLVPAAAASQITGENAGKISARLIIEGANSPTTPEADEILNRRGVMVVPDILANAGGVFVSYLEYTQETQQEQMTEQEVCKRLQQRMIERFSVVYGKSKEMKRPMREAAMYLALKTVSSAVMARGLLP
jgi:glutamate dehydrogenase/leucine dehydrogenase